MLPLDAGKLKSIAVVGPNADNDLAQLGDWSLGTSQHPAAKGKQPRECTVTLLDGIAPACPRRSRCATSPAARCAPADTSQIPAALAVCADADVIVLVVGDDIPFIGEGNSTATLELLGGQRALVDAVMALGKPVVLTLVNSKPLVLPRVGRRRGGDRRVLQPRDARRHGVRRGLVRRSESVGQADDFVSAPRRTAAHVLQPGARPTRQRIRGFDASSALSVRSRAELHALRVRELAGSHAAPARRSKPLEVSVRSSATPGSATAPRSPKCTCPISVTSVTWVNQDAWSPSTACHAGGGRNAQRELRASRSERLALIDAYERSVVEPGEFEISVGPSSVDADLAEGDASWSRASHFPSRAFPGVARARG